MVRFETAMLRVLEVPEKEFERSEQMLIDWNREGMLCDAIRCPQCGSFRLQFPQFARKSNIPNVFIGLAAEVGLVEKDFYCEDCRLKSPKPSDKPEKERRHTLAPMFIDYSFVAARKSACLTCEKGRLA